MVRQKHTQFPGPGRTEAQRRSASGCSPAYAAKAGGFFFIVFGVLAALGGFAQINPIWLFGPYNPARGLGRLAARLVHGFLDGSTRLFPSWEIHGLWPLHDPGRSSGRPSCCPAILFTPGRARIRSSRRG